MRLLGPDDYYPINLNKLPDQWKAVVVGDAISDIQPGFASGIHNQEGMGVPHLRPMNIDRKGRLDLSIIKFVPPNNPLRIKRGEVLFNNTNSSELVGKTTTIEREGDWAFSNHMTRLRPSTGLSAKFVAYQFHYLWMSGYFRHRCTHHVNQASIASKTLAETVPLIIGPTNEQHRIVAEIEKQLTRLDVGVAALKRAQSNLQRYRASVLRAACAGRLVPTEAELAHAEIREYEPADQLLTRILKERRATWEADQIEKVRKTGKVPKDDKWKTKYQEPAGPDTTGLPDLPEGWVWTNLVQLKSFSLYGPRFSSDDYSTSGPLVLRTSDISDSGKVNFNTAPRLPLAAEELAKYRVEQGDLLITRTGSLGTLAIFNDTVDAIPGAYLIQYRLIVPLETSWYVFYFLKSPIGQKQLVGGGAGVGRPNLNAPTIEDIPIPLPPLVEQHRIVAEVERRLSLIDELEAISAANLRRSERLRQSILNRAFEGKLVPQDPNDESASVLLEHIRSERSQHGAERNTTKKVIPRAGSKKKKPPALEAQADLFH